MKKIFYLSTCSTCAAIMKDVGTEGFVLQDIKAQNIDSDDLRHAASKLGGYEALFSRRALKFRQWGLHEKQLTETDYRDLILREYTFLKRPVFFIDGDVFAGNTKANVEAVKARLRE